MKKINNFKARDKFERMCTNDYIVYSAATLQVKPATALSLPARPFTRYMSLSLQKSTRLYTKVFLMNVFYNPVERNLKIKKKK